MDLPLGLFSASRHFPAACAIISVRSTPGTTGKPGKWSPKYSSSGLIVFNARMDSTRYHLKYPVYENESHFSPPTHIDVLIQDTHEF